MIAIVLALVCCLTAPAEVSLDKNTILLGDLIEFAEGDLRSTLLLGQAPNPGLARKIHDYEILGKLRVSGLRIEDLDLPESVLVRRQSVPLDVERVRFLVQELFSRRYPEARVEIQEMVVPAIDVTTAEVQITGSLPTNINVGGRVSVQLDIRGEGFARSVYVQTRVHVEPPQPVLERPVRAHARVLEDDVQWRFAPLNGSGEVVQSLDQIRGMLAKQDLEPGQVLTTSQLYSPVLVRRGDAVTIVAAVGNITISAMMKARSSGEYGQTIIVEHLNGSGQTTARVTGQGTVQALVGGR